MLISYLTKSRSNLDELVQRFLQRVAQSCIAIELISHPFQ